MRGVEAPPSKKGVGVLSSYVPPSGMVMTVISRMSSMFEMFPQPRCNIDQFRYIKFQTWLRGLAT